MTVRKKNAVNVYCRTGRCSWFKETKKLKTKTRVVKLQANNVTSRTFVDRQQNTSQTSG